ncbi:phosphoglycerate mutase [Pelomyxa schiedti]|nr:phosphoglycerate mutase [Pelomyxa schiedti]
MGKKKGQVAKVALLVDDVSTTTTPSTATSASPVPPGGSTPGGVPVGLSPQAAQTLRMLRECPKAECVAIVLLSSCLPPLAPTSTPTPTPTPSPSSSSSSSSSTTTATCRPHSPTPASTSAPSSSPTPTGSPASGTTSGRPGVGVGVAAAPSSSLSKESSPSPSPSVLPSSPAVALSPSPLPPSSSSLASTTPSTAATAAASTTTVAPATTSPLASSTTTHGPATPTTSTTPASTTGTGSTTKSDPPRVFISWAEFEASFSARGATSIDAVWICTEAISTRGVIAQSAADVSRVVYCPAPLALNEADIKIAYEVCASKGAELVVGWPRRFDSGFMSLFEELAGANIASAHFVNKLWPLPQTKLASLPSIFMELMSHDFNLSSFFMNEQMPLTVAASGRDTYGTGVWDSATCTVEYSAGRTVVIEVSRFGDGKVENSVTLVANGRTKERGKDTFAINLLQRYESSLQAQVEYLSRVCLGEKVWQLCSKDFCVATTQLALLAEQSAREGRKLSVASGPAVNLLQVGEDPFIQNKILTQLPCCKSAYTFTGLAATASTDDASYQKFEEFMTSCEANAAYICLDHKHSSYVAERCLRANMRVIVDHPVQDFNSVMQASKSKDKLLMIRFFCRYDKKFQKARDLVAHLASEGSLSTVTIETTDPLPPCNDTIETILTSGADDFDIVAWMFDTVDCDISQKYMRIIGAPSSYVACFSVRLRKYDKVIEASLQYTRGGGVHSRIVRVNSVEFIRRSEMSLTLSPRDLILSAYVDAIAKQFRSFSTKILPPSQNGSYCTTYMRTHQILYNACESIVDEAVDTDSLLSSSPPSLASYPLALRNRSRSTGTASLIPTVPLANSIAISSKPPPSVSPEPVLPRTSVSSTAVTQPVTFTRGGLVYKPLVTNEAVEWRAYTQVRETIPALCQWMPTFKEKALLNGVTYLVTDDISQEYKRPRILTIKVGEPSDFQRMHNQPYGLKVCGYTGDSHKNIHRSNLSWNDLSAMLKDFIKDKESGNLRYEVIPIWLQQLRQLLELVGSQTQFIFRAAVFKLMYDGVDDSMKTPLVKLYDISRAKESGGETDHCLCMGLENLSQLLQELHTKFINRHAVFLCRHGFCIEPSDRQWHSKYPMDPPLSSQGVQQAHELAQRLKHENISIVISSPFARAKQTAEIIAEELNIKYMLEPVLGEVALDTGYGSSARLSDALDPTLPQKDEFLLESLVPSSPPSSPSLFPHTPAPTPTASSSPPQTASPPTVRSLQILQNRMHKSLEAICQQYKRVAIVGHRATFEALLATICSAPDNNKFSSHQRSFEFASVSTLLPTTSSTTGWAIDRLNMPSHSASVPSPTQNTTTKS